jgi:hypothetical protein
LQQVEQLDGHAAKQVPDGAVSTRRLSTEAFSRLMGHSFSLIGMGLPAANPPVQVRNKQETSEKKWQKAAKKWASRVAILAGGVHILISLSVSYQLSVYQFRCQSG